MIHVDSDEAKRQLAQATSTTEGQLTLCLSYSPRGEAPDPLAVNGIT